MNVLVNTEKAERAQQVLNLLNGVTQPKNPDHQEMIRVFSGFLQEAKLSPKDAGAHELIYVKLGGLIRTEEEEKAAQVRKQEMQAKGRKRMVE